MAPEPDKQCIWTCSLLLSVCVFLQEKYSCLWIEWGSFSVFRNSAIVTIFGGLHRYKHIYFSCKLLDTVPRFRVIILSKLFKTHCQDRLHKPICLNSLPLNFMHYKRPYILPFKKTNPLGWFINSLPLPITYMFYKHTISHGRVVQYTAL